MTEDPHSYVLGVCQFQPQLFDKAYNLRRIAELAAAAAGGGAELVIFPECCVTGYTTGPELTCLKDLAEPVCGPGCGPSVLRLQSLATELGAMLLCGIPELAPEGVYNTCAFFTPGGGAVAAFRKAHLWRSEAEVFQEAQSLSVEPGPRGLLAAAVCYDLEFPELVREVCLLGADLVAVSTANMEPWGEHQRVYARARAMENTVHVALANCIGRIGDSVAVGGSIVVDPYGQVLAQASSDKEAVLLAEVDFRRNHSASQELGYRVRRRPGLYSKVASQIAP